MGKARLEAFSDGVIAIIITIMVLELKVPHEASWHGLSERWPIFLSYALSFFFVAVYWTNHHHLIHTVVKATPAVLWLNLHLLFWLSLVPFVTEWLGETYPAPAPTIVYGVVMFMAGLGYTFLLRAISAQRTDGDVHDAQRRHAVKGRIALTLYSAGVVLAWYGVVQAALLLYLCVAIAYVIPERAFEHGSAG